MSKRVERVLNDAAIEEDMTAGPPFKAWTDNAGAPAPL
jgi:hypothetical protein